jgi:hypothetical protein
VSGLGREAVGLSAGLAKPSRRSRSRSQTTVERPCFAVLGNQVTVRVSINGEVSLVNPALGPGSPCRPISNDWRRGVCLVRGCIFTGFYGGNCWDWTKGLG